MHDVFRAAQAGRFPAGDGEYDAPVEPGRLPSAPSRVSAGLPSLASGLRSNATALHGAAPVRHVRGGHRDATQHAKGSPDSPVLPAGANGVQTQARTTHLAEEAHGDAHLHLRRLRQDVHQELALEGASPNPHR